MEAAWPDYPIDNPGTRTTYHRVKRKTLIITDPKKMFERYSNQPRVSRERAIHSILAQNGKANTQAPAKAS
jgi:hypothetical protein